MDNIIFIEGLSAIVYLIIKRCAMYIWDHDRTIFIMIRRWYHWMEYVFIFTCGVLAPPHTIDQGIFTLFVVILIKIIFDQMTFLDPYLKRRFGE